MNKNLNISQPSYLTRTFKLLLSSLPLCVQPPMFRLTSVLRIGIISLLVPLSSYLYRKYKQSSKYEEFEQIITPLDITPNDVLTGIHKDKQYLPFRYPYHQTMALVKLDMNYWGTLDADYVRFMTGKRKIFQDYNMEKLIGGDVFATDDEYCDVFTELRDFVVNHYTHRFPKCFSQNGNIVYNHLMDEQYDVTVDDPLLIATKIAMEDFYVVGKDKSTQLQKCIGVSVAYGGGGFPITPIVGQVMDEIHDRVPYYESKLKKSMDKWFDKFTDPVERQSWHIDWDSGNMHCSEFYAKLRELNETDYLEYVKTVPFEKFNVRIERQALIKLPKSQAIIFTSRPVFLNIVEELADVPMVPGILLKMMYESPKDIIKHRHFDILREAITEPIKKLVERQVEMGLIESVDSPVRTVPNFPFRYKY